MSGEAGYDPASGTLRASPAGFRALRAAARGEAIPGDDGRAELEAGGALVAGAPHPALAPALEAIRAAVAELTLARGDRTGRAWVGARVTALLVPEPDGLLKLASLPTTFLPAALARLNDLGPRPRVEPAVRLRLSAGELAGLLAARESAPPARLAPDEADALRTLLATLREHWRVEAHWLPAEGLPGVRAVEVVDTEAGLWLVIPDDPQVELWPTTPTAVFRQLAALLPKTHELGAPPA